MSACGRSQAACAADNPDESPWPTFWRQDTAGLQSELFSFKAPCLTYSGEGDLVWPAWFIAGGWPGATDEAGCAVSSGLAYALWGSTDVVGKTVEADGKSLTVRGVFEGQDPLCLARTGDSDPAGGWQRVELRSAPALTRAKAEEFAAKSGLGAPDMALSSGAGDAAALLGWLPLAAGAALWGGRKLVRWGRMHPLGLRASGFGLVLALALLLPTLLSLLPAWLTPSRWSDFSFWGHLAKTLASRFDEFLALSPSLRDIAAKKALLAAAGAGLASLFPALWLGWRWAAPAAPPLLSVALNRQTPRASGTITSGQRPLGSRGNFLSASGQQGLAVLSGLPGPLPAFLAAGPFPGA